MTDIICVVFWPGMYNLTLIMRKHQANALLKKEGEGELYSLEVSLMITEDKEWLWK